ncbi:MAG: AraC family transcriptional regulator, partial [Actinomycetota bacterium]
MAHLVLEPGTTTLIEWLAEQSDRPWAAPLADAITEKLAYAHARVAAPLPLPSDDGLRRVALALLDNPSDRRDVATWAGEVGYVPRTFRRRFVAETGMAFAGWRHELRMRTAMSLLVTAEPVEVVARRCGYTSTPAFTRAFKSATGIPPSRFGHPGDQIVQPERGVWPPQRDWFEDIREVSLTSVDLSTFSRRSAAVLAGAGLMLLAIACGDGVRPLRETPEPGRLLPGRSPRWGHIATRRSSGVRRSSCIAARSDLVL